MKTAHKTDRTSFECYAPRRSERARYSVEEHTTSSRCQMTPLSIHKFHRASLSNFLQVLKAFRYALAVRARSRLVRHQSVIEGRKLTLNDLSFSLPFLFCQ